MSDSTNPSYNDVLSGRGKFAMYWEGNKFFRALIEYHKADYLVGNNKTKQEVATKIVQTIRTLKPRGNFLVCHQPSHEWRDIGDIKAIRKTRQALREGAPPSVANNNSNCFIDSTQRGDHCKESNFKLPAKKIFKVS